MNRVRVASGLYSLLAAHVAIDGAYPLLHGWKVKLESVPFFIAAGLLLLSLLLLVVPLRARVLGFAVACCCAVLAAAGIIVPLALDGEFAPGSYPYPGGQLFGVIQLAGHAAAVALLRRPLASNKLLQATRARLSNVVSSQKCRFSSCRLLNRGMVGFPLA